MRMTFGFLNCRNNVLSMLVVDTKLVNSPRCGMDLKYYIIVLRIRYNSYCKLFNFIFSSSSYPLSWTKGVIVPVPKKGRCK